MANQRTEDCLKAIREYATGQEGIVAAIFSHCFGLAATSAAFRMALKQGLIERYATGGMNNPIYRRTGVQ